MATHIAESRKVVRKYLHSQWTTMFTILGNLESSDQETKTTAQSNFEAFEEAISFPYNQKLAYFPVDASIDSVENTGRARGEFGIGSLVPSLEDPSYPELAAQQSAMLASLYARQEFIRAAARMPMTLFVGPEATTSGEQSSAEGVLLTAEKFSRVVFSGITEGSAAQYVAVAELSRTYPQTAVVRMWWSSDDQTSTNHGQVIKDMEKRWLEIGGRKGKEKILFQRGTHRDEGIPLFTLGLKNKSTMPLYMRWADSPADMWANVIALTASDKHGDTKLLDASGGKKLWEGEGDDDDVSMEGWQWMAAMLALRRIPYIVKSEDPGDANKDPLPHALTRAEAITVKDMMGAIIIARGGDKKKSSGINSKLGSRQQKKRVIFAETAKWW